MEPNKDNVGYIDSIYRNYTDCKSFKNTAFAVCSWLKRYLTTPDNRVYIRLSDYDYSAFPKPGYEEHWYIDEHIHPTIRYIPAHCADRLRAQCNMKEK